MAVETNDAQDENDANGQDMHDDFLDPDMIGSGPRTKHPDEIGEGWHPGRDFIDPLSHVCWCDTLEKQETIPAPTGIGDAFGPEEQLDSAEEVVGAEEHLDSEEEVICPEEWRASEKGPRKRADVGRYGESAKLALRRLNGEERRHISPGCQLPTLPEDEESLRKEIDYYHRKQPADPPDIKDFARADIVYYWMAWGVLDAVTDQNPQPHTAAGFFNDPEALIEALADIRAARGIYLTPNPITPALLMRAPNRICRAVKGQLTQDTDVVRRKWFPLDLDPKRPAGVPSTAAELSAALKLRNGINRYLADHGWPKPITCMSGNGFHLMYQIDLPANDGGLVQRCLEALAKQFDNAEVQVDRTVCNPARIWRLYGTMACKGTPSAERPHRTSKILDAPEPVITVPVRLLEELAAEAGNTNNKPKNHDGRLTIGQTVDVPAFIREHGLDVTGPEPWSSREGEGQRWVFNRSPMCEHHDSAAFIVQLGNGAVQAKCHHNSCSCIWADLRARYEVARPQATVPPLQLGTSTKPATVELPKVRMPGGRARFTEDFANRSSVIRLRKQKEGYPFLKYPEGDLLKHVEANRHEFLAAVFSVVKAWYEAGRPVSSGVSHDFRQWAAILDWIVVKLLGAAPLMQGHQEIKRRTTSPSLTWLRNVAHAAEAQEMLGKPLRPHNILDIICRAGEIEVPGLKESDNIDDEATRLVVFRAIGKRLADCMDSDGRAEVDEYRVERHVTSDAAGHEVKEYQFERLQPRKPPASDPEVSPE
jgi:hypothetical protein